MYEVIYDRAALKQLRKLPSHLSVAILDAADRLVAWPNHGCDVKPLEGPLHGHWRLRVGDYRAIFTVNDATRQITVSRVKHRGKGY